MKMSLSEHQSRRKFGQHFTSREIFKEYIFPLIKDSLYEYIFVDLFCGSGNLILPILDEIPERDRIEYFKENIFLFDVQERWISKTIDMAVEYGIPQDVAEKNICMRDTLAEYPKFLTTLDKKVFHITNPPYLYLGYIVKTEETQKYLPLFTGNNEGYQDLYQLALINDLRHNINNMIYIIPSNFIFGNSVSNKIRLDFFPHYKIKSAYIFEKKIFEHTGQNVMINHFIRNSLENSEPIEFIGKKFRKNDEDPIEKQYVLHPKNKYKAGGEFQSFIKEYKSSNSLKVEYYLKLKEVDKNKGTNTIHVIDSNNYKGTNYMKLNIFVNDEMSHKIKNNQLWIRTVDTGTWEGRAGLYHIKSSFDVDGILVTKNPYRTNPIQIYLTPELSPKDQIILKTYFNLMLENLRTIADSEFMTTYKYSKGPYTRKYFGLSQCRQLISTFPTLNDENRNTFRELVNKKDINKIKKFLKSN